MEEDGEVYISLTHALAEHADQVTEAQEAIADAYDARPRGGIFEVPPEVMERLGYVQVARDNTYNTDNDLDQDFVWEVWQREGAAREWFYDDTAIVLVYVHTGADIRGGYAPALALRFDGDYTVPFFRVSYYCEDTGDTSEGLPDDTESADVENFTVTTEEGDVYTADWYP